jgi:undecaprenyl-diphosphatase
VEEILEAAILGIVQGLTEFLPISSTGHLVLTSDLLGIDDKKFGLQFDAAIHLGTLAAVLVYFRTTVLSLIGAWFASLPARDWQHTPESRLAWLLVLGTIPAGIAGIALESTVEDQLRDPAIVAAMLILFCVPMLLAERYGSRTRDVTSTGPIDALIIGAAQAVALIPGVSRSGITISTGMFAGFKREEAATFAFLLSAPIIAAAGGKQVFDLLRGHDDGTSAGIGVYAVGLVTAAIVGYAAVAFLLRFLRTNSLHFFVHYRIALGLLVLALVVAGVL